MESNYNISFGSKINFVSSAKFKNLLSKNVKPQNIVDEPWTFEAMRTADEFLGTAGINTCSGGCFADSKKASLFHFSTDEKNFFTIDKFISKISDMFNSQKCKSALLVGSKPANVPVLPGKAPDVQSENLFEILKFAMKDLKPTILEGHRNAASGTNFIYDPKRDTYYVNTLLNVFDDTSYVKNMDDLKNAFKNIHISPNDMVVFNP